MFCKAVCCIVKNILRSVIIYSDSWVRLPQWFKLYLINRMEKMGHTEWPCFCNWRPERKHTADPTFEQLWWTFFHYHYCYTSSLVSNKKRWPNFEVNTSHYEVACLVLLCLRAAGVAAAWGVVWTVWCEKVHKLVACVAGAESPRPTPPRPYPSSAFHSLSRTKRAAQKMLQREKSARH